MRHGKKFNHLGRKSAHRKAMLSNMASSLIEHKRITTTLAKAKALRKFVEPLITKAKDNTTHSRRVVFSYLQNKDAIKELFGPIASAVYDRPGGYTRILKLGPRPGDSAEMALIELVDFNELAPAKAASGGKKKRRRRGKGGAGKSQQKVAPAVEEAVVETPEVVEEVIEDAAVVEETVEEVVEETAEEVVAEEAVVEEAPVEEPVAEDAPVEEAPAEEPVAEEAPAVEPDDFKKIEGIGPKISSLLHDAGILTFAQLAETDADRIREILAAAGNRYKAHDPSTWPKQSGMAAEGKWDELKKWQDELDGGKE
ncbi:MAG: 50S ribosomal protein L17 [Bacteroidota bacterium]